MTIAFAFLVFPYGLNSAFAQGQLNDPSLIIQVMVDGLASPTSLIFLDNNNILLLEKIESNNQRGLLGIAYDGVKVYLFVTENGAQVEGTSTENEVRNRVYSYAWDGSSLSDPQLLLDLPATPAQIIKEASSGTQSNHNSMKLM